MEIMSAFIPRVLLYKGSGVIGSLIRWQTRGKYAHAALQVGHDEIIESMQGHGVRSRHADDLHDADAYLVPGCTPEKWMAVIAFARAQIGKPYDYLSVFRFLDRAPGDGRDSWFCSELVFAALMAGDVRLLERVDAWAVSPSMLSMSPLITPDVWERGARAFFRAVTYEDPRVRDWKLNLTAR